MVATPAVATTQEELPAPNSNFYRLVKHSMPDGRATVKKAHAEMWTTPQILAIAVGLEINAYACANVT